MSNAVKSQPKRRRWEISTRPRGRAEPREPDQPQEAQRREDGRAVLGRVARPRARGCADARPGQRRDDVDEERPADVAVDDLRAPELQQPVLAPEPRVQPQANVQEEEERERVVHRVRDEPAAVGPERDGVPIGDETLDETKDRLC